MQRITRVRQELPTQLTLALTALLMTFLLLAACGEPVPSASTLLQEAQTKFGAAHSFHFNFYIELEGSSASPTGGLYVTRAQGVAQRPDKLSATVGILSPSGSIPNAQVIVVGGQGWLLSPPSTQYEATDQVLTLANFFDPQTGIGTLLTQIEQPHPLDSYKDVWITYGAIPANRLSGMLPGLAEQTDQVNINIDISKRDHQLVGMNLEGVLFPRENAHTSHIFSISQFDAPVDIQPPTASSSGGGASTVEQSHETTIDDLLYPVLFAGEIGLLVVFLLRSILLLGWAVAGRARRHARARLALGLYMLAVGVALVVFGTLWPEFRADAVVNSQIFIIGVSSILLGSLLFIEVAIALGGIPWPLVAGVGVAWVLVSAVLVRFGVGALSPLLACDGVVVLLGLAILVRLKQQRPALAQVLLLASAGTTAISILVAVRGFGDWFWPPGGFDIITVYLLIGAALYMAERRLSRQGESVSTAS
jgi:hypothetical protein